MDSSSIDLKIRVCTSRDCRLHSPCLARNRSAKLQPSPQQVSLSLASPRTTVITISCRGPEPIISAIILDDSSWCLVLETSLLVISLFYVAEQSPLYLISEIMSKKPDCVTHTSPVSTLTADWERSHTECTALHTQLHIQQSSSLSILYYLDL